jgi:hypothetical protein
VLRGLACLALAALFGVSAAAREGRDHPSLERLLSNPRRWEGAELRLTAFARAASVAEVDGLLLPVRGELPVGKDVELRGVFRGGCLELTSVRALAPWTPIPALVLAWAVWNFFRHFRARA